MADNSRLHISEEMLDKLFNDNFREIGFNTVESYLQKNNPATTEMDFPEIFQMMRMKVNFFDWGATPEVMEKLESKFRKLYSRNKDSNIFVLNKGEGKSYKIKQGYLNQMRLGKNNPNKAYSKEEGYITDLDEADYDSED